MVWASAPGGLPNMPRACQPQSPLTPLLTEQVVTVDLSLVPPAYSIELETGVRETEGNRLRTFGTIGEQAPSDDPATAAKEAAARALEV